MFYDNSERKKKAKRLWQEFRDIECMITKADSNYFEVNSCLIVRQNLTD